MVRCRCFGGRRNLVFGIPDANNGMVNVGPVGNVRK